MGADTYCLICGCTFRQPIMGMNVCMDDRVRRFFDDPEVNNWCRKVTIIKKDNQNVNITLYDAHPEYDDPELFHYGNFGSFHTDNNVVEYNLSRDLAGEEHCIAAHTECIQLLKDEFDYELKYKDYEIDDYTNLIKGQDYGLITGYQEQWFNFLRMYDGGSRNYYMLKSPLKNEKNKGRIVKLWTKIFSGKVEKPVYWEGICDSRSGGKFWKIDFDPTSPETTIVTFGSLGSDGQKRTKTHSTVVEAKEYADKQTAAKKKKGYS